MLTTSNSDKHEHKANTLEITITGDGFNLSELGKKAEESQDLKQAHSNQGKEIYVGTIISKQDNSTNVRLLDENDTNENAQQHDLNILGKLNSGDRYTRNSILSEGESSKNLLLSPNPIQSEVAAVKEKMNSAYFMSKPETQITKDNRDKLYEEINTREDSSLNKILNNTEGKAQILIQKFENTIISNSVISNGNNPNNLMMNSSASGEEWKRTYDTSSTSTLDSEILKKELQAIYQQPQYTALPRLFSNANEENIANTFVNVALLTEKEVKGKEKELDKTKDSEDKRLHSHERLYKFHESIPIGDLFDPRSLKANSHSFMNPEQEQPPKKLLIHGRAGIGKTVLCHYLITQWSADKLKSFRQFKAVFLIKLRELADKLEKCKSINETFMLAEMVTLCCLTGNKWRDENRKHQLQLWLENHPKGTLFILDGYDEIADSATLGNFAYCLKSVLNQPTYKPYILLTSRPIAIHHDYGRFDHQLECMGFTNENIDVFVRHYFNNNSTHNTECLNFLKGHASIWGTAHIPINLELICWLWSKGDLSRTQKQCFTIAALYNEIVTRLKKENQKNDKHSSLKNPYNYGNFENKCVLATIAENFLAFISFHAMQQTEILLKGKFIQKCLQLFIQQQQIKQTNGLFIEEEQLLQACLDLGILKSIQEGEKNMLDQTCYFIHLSFQEFFAAKYYQHNFEYSNTAVMTSFKTNKYTPRYQLTWWMTAGLLYLNQEEKESKNYFALTSFFQTLCSEPLDWIGVQHFNLLSHCLDECKADESIEMVKRLLKHQAQFLKKCLEEDWLGRSWGQTLLSSCPNLPRSKAFQQQSLALAGFKVTETVELKDFRRDIFERNVNIISYFFPLDKIYVLVRVRIKV